jgi:predicted phage terminase large subunit-like protein
MSKKTEAAKELLSKRRAREGLLDFTTYTKKNYQVNWHHDLVCQKLDQFVAGEIRRLIISMPPRHGKQLADSTPILTTEGWKKHGDLKKGDRVFHPSGVPIKVLAVSGKTPSDWVVTFNNGHEIRCHGNHEWLIYNRSSGKFQTIETKWFQRTTKHGTSAQVMSRGRCIFQIPLSSVIQFDEKKLPMHPYVLGAWLGDGSRNKPCVTHDKKDSAVIDKIISSGYPVSSVCVHKTTGVYTTYFSGPRPNVSGRMTLELTSLGLRNTKFIPEIFLRSSIDQRLQLLAGLADTDGHCDENGRIRFTTADKPLADGVFDLCTTLGFRPYIQTVDPQLSSSGIQGRKPYYVIGFNPTLDIPCALERKRPKRLAPQRKIGITNIRYEPNGEVGNCIEVDSEDGLYLAGESLLTTHNSELVSRRLPAYLFGKHPETNIIACSYSSDLASRMNRDVQRVIDSPEYHTLFPDVSLNSSNVRSTAQGSHLRNSDIFEIVGSSGVYRSAGVGGGITGMGFKYGIIDDPIKNREEAESATIRNKVYEWYTDTFYTRQEEDAAILLTMTRWHEDDLVGRLLDLAKNDPDADQWEVITLPAVSEEERPDYDKRPDEGLALWPGKYPENVMKKIQATVPVYTWLSLYQQRPSAAKGNLFKRDSFQYFTEGPLTYDLHTGEGIVQVPKKSCTMFQTCDPAGTDKTYSDYFVLSTWALTPKKDLLLLDVFRTKLEGADHMEFFRKHSKLPGLVLLGFESAGIGKTTYQNLKRERFPLVDLEPKGDKFTRALSAAIRMNLKTTYFRQGAHWLTDWEAELLKFPNSKNDDQVDTLSYADYCIVNDLIKTRIPTSMTWGGVGLSGGGFRV